MPVYEYECQACKFYTELMQKITDAPLAKCPSCGKRRLKRLVSAPVFRLKGAGWYETDFKSDKEAKRNLLAAEKEEAKAESKAESKTEAKEAAAAGKEAKEAKAATEATPAAAAKAAPKEAGTAAGSEAAGAAAGARRRTPAGRAPAARRPSRGTARRKTRRGRR